MVLNELIEKYSLDAVSRQTRIATEYLEALLERNCGKMKRVQAMGFISILEREYGIDISSLKKECSNYFDSSTKEKRDIYEEITVVSKEDENETSRFDKWKQKISPITLENLRLKQYLNKILIGLLLIVGSYGAWQKFVPNSLDENSSVDIKIEEESSTIEQEKPKSDKKEGFFDSVVSMFKSEERQEEEKLTQTSSSSTTKTEEKAEVVKEETPEPPKPKEKKEEKPKGVAQKNSTVEDEIIKRVKAEENMKSKKGEDSYQEVPQISDLISSATAGVDDIVDDTKIDEAPLDTEVPSMGDDTETTETTETTKTTTLEETPEPLRAKPKSEEKKVKKVEEKKEKSRVDEGKYETIIFHPRSKVWIGYTNLSNMRRKVVTGADDLNFDVRETSYILATGHGRVEFMSRRKSLLKLGDGKKHFFKISKSGVKEITHKEFQKLNKSKVW